MSTRTNVLPELRIALANFGPGDIVTGSAERWETAMRWDRTVSVLREWQPHIVLCQEISATDSASRRGHLWTTANTLGMIPLPGSPGPGPATIGCTAILVAVSAGLLILDAGPDWPSQAGVQPAWCEALVQVPGWLHPLRACSVDLSRRSSVEQRSQADHLASRICPSRRSRGRRRELEFLRPRRPGHSRRAGLRATARAAFPDAVFAQRTGPDPELRRA
jgi:hypothetical protein